MAMAKGQQSVDSVARTLYSGVASVQVLGVNMSKAELEKLYDRQIDEEPKYVGEVEIDGKKYPNVRVAFVTRTNPDKNNGIDTTTNHTYFVQKRYRKGSQSGKYQVIDIYGRTAWAVENVDFKIENGKFVVIQVPQYANGPANIDIDYRPCFVGEEELTMFYKNLLNIPNIQSYVNGQWVPNHKVDPSACYARLDCIEDYFKGDFKELKEMLTFQPENLVKILFGVRTTDDNKQYQTTYTQMTLRNSVTDYSKLDADVQSRKAAGALATTEFEVSDLHEYVVNPSNLNPTLEQAAAANIAGEESPW